MNKAIQTLSRQSQYQQGSICLALTLDDKSSDISGGVADTSCMYHVSNSTPGATSEYNQRASNMVHDQIQQLTRSPISMAIKSMSTQARAQHKRYQK